MKKIFLLLVMVLILSLSVFAESNISTLDLGSSLAFGKNIEGFTGGLSLESKQFSTLIMDLELVLLFQQKFLYFNLQMEKQLKIIIHFH